MSAATRARVHAAIDQLGYRPNRAARGLITGRTGNLGLIVPDLANPFFAGVAKGVQARARAASHAVFIADTDEDAAGEQGIVAALAKEVDGIVLCAPRGSDAEITALAQRTPLVLMQREVHGLPSIVTDHADGMRQVVGHLVALGHRRIAYVDGPKDSWTGQRRRDGLLAAAAAADVELLQLGHFSPQFEGGAAAADLVAASGATAVLAYNDIVALGLLGRLADRGIAVPGALSVVGIDDVPAATMSRPSLTTLAAPKQEAGRAAVDLLIDVIRAGSDEVATTVEMPTQLIVRDSTAPAGP